MPRKHEKKETMAAVDLSELTEAEQGLLSHLQTGYQSETDSLGHERYCVTWNTTGS